MILSTASYEDIFKAIVSDEEKVYFWWEKLYQKNYRRFQEQLDKDIMVMWVYFTHPQSKNRYLFWYVTTPLRYVLDKDNVTGGHVLVVSDFNDRNFYISSAKSRPGFIYHMTSHFLKRYRERFLGNTDAPTEEVLSLYLYRNIKYSVSIENQEMSLRPDSDPDTRSLLIPDGVVFVAVKGLALRNGTSVIVFRCKTFVSRSILNEKQLDYLDQVAEEKRAEEIRRLLNIVEEEI